MDKWLGTLEAQLTASATNTGMQHGVPDIELAWEWSRRFAELTLRHIDKEMDSTGQIGYRTACNNQMALVALLVCGAEAPPCRLHHLKTVLHPIFNGKFKCTDPDCNTSKCKGNRLEIVFKEGHEPPQEPTPAGGGGGGGGE